MILIELTVTGLELLAADYASGGLRREILAIKVKIKSVCLYLHLHQVGLVDNTMLPICFLVDRSTRCNTSLWKWFVLCTSVPDVDGCLVDGCLLTLSSGKRVSSGTLGLC